MELIQTSYKKPDLTWAIKNVQSLMNQYIEGNYIALFPFCSSKHKNKVWPYFKDLIKEIKNIYGRNIILLWLLGLMKLVWQKN